jgi:hypothetical protein
MHTGFTVRRVFGQKVIKAASTFPSLTLDPINQISEDCHFACSPSVVVVLHCMKSGTLSCTQCKRRGWTAPVEGESDGCLLRR